MSTFASKAPLLYYAPMFIVEVVPLMRGNTADALSYYCAEPLPIGALVTIPVRKREVQGLVIDLKPVSAAKAALRAATFSLRKLQSQKDVPVLPEAVLKAAQMLAGQYPATIGSILYTLLPSDIRNGERSYPRSTGSSAIGNEPSVTSVLSGLATDRYITYRSQIRETFAKRGSTLFVVPTTAEVAQAAAALSHGIDKRVVTFAHTHGKRARDKAFASFMDSKEPKLIIATPGYAFLHRADIASIIIEHAGSPHYKDRRRPYLDMREALKAYAKAGNCSLLLGDLVVATEDEARRREDFYGTYGEHVQRISFTAPLTIVERVADETSVKKKFDILLPETVAAIKRVLALKGKVFLYAARRGLSPAIVCYDCGYLFRCPDSGTPYALLRSFDGEAERRWFVSSTSGKKVRAADVCPACGSWRLREQGFGIQLIEDEVKALFPTVPVTTFDSTTATTSTKAEKIASDFAHTKGMILLGTAMSLTYLPEHTDLTVITSYEAARTMSTWRADETMFSLILHLRERTEREMIIQTRSEIDPLLRLVERGALDAFYNDEIAVRQSLLYPPFAVFILLTMMGNAADCATAESVIEASVRNHTVQYYNAPDATPERTIRYGLIRIPRESWPAPELIESLRHLPPYIKIEVNPERIV